MSTADDEDKELDEFVEALSAVISVFANEVVAFRRIERYLDPPLATLAVPEEVAALTGRVEALSGRLGGPPRLLLVDSRTGRAEGNTVYDTYGAAALDEMTRGFHRARSAALRAHAIFIVLEGLKAHPELLKGDEDDGARQWRRGVMENQFWEALELATIRLCSFSDRMGQVLDFVFFNVRQYERDGFAAVMDRIHANFSVAEPLFAGHSAWRTLRGYQTDASEMGFQWLVRRRNLVVHSVALKQSAGDGEDPIFLAAYNHLEATVVKKLRQGGEDEELGRIHAHLNVGAKAYSAVLDLCMFGVETYGLRPPRLT